MRNTFGHLFRLTTFGESHGEAIGGVIDGCPAGIDVDMGFIQHELDRRRPGQSHITTGRQEPDRVELLSGVFEGKTTGCPIGLIGISVHAYTSQVGGIRLDGDYRKYDIEAAEGNIVRCPDKEKAAEMARLIAEAKAEGDTMGGVITCVIKGCPAGLGEPEFDKLQAALGYAMLGINAVKGIEFGEGFGFTTMKGSEANDIFINHNGRITTKTNRSGGIQGGISNGEDIYFRIAFKPVATLLKEQQTVDLQGNATTLTAHGRHDPCVLPRAVPIVEAMAAMTILDQYLLCGTIKI